MDEFGPDESVWFRATCLLTTIVQATSSPSDSEQYHIAHFPLLAESEQYSLIPFYFNWFPVYMLSKPNDFQTLGLVMLFRFTWLIAGLLSL